jgi:O-antigen ligase
MAGMLYTSNLEEGTSILRRLMPLLAFPLILSTCSLQLQQKQFVYLVLNFVVCCFIGSLICLAGAALNYWQTGSYNSFFYHEFAAYIQMQGIYFSIYIGFCIIALGWLLFTRQGMGVFRNKSILSGLIGFFLLILILLSIRVAIAGMLLVIILSIIRHYHRKKQILKGLLVCFLLASSVALATFLNPVSREKFLEAFNFQDSIVLDASQDTSLEKGWGGRAIRVAIWRCAWDVIKENPLVGVGTGDVQDKLQDSYRANNFLFAADYNRYNAHNQFIETQLAIGMFGLINLLLIFILPFLISVRKHKYLYAAFLIFLAINCTTESVLIRQKGAIFFGLFNSIMAFQYLDGAQRKHQEHPD